MNGCDPFEQMHGFADLDTPKCCPQCGTTDTSRLFHSAPVHFAGGRTGFHNNTGRDLYQRTKETLIAKHGVKHFKENFDTHKVDPDDMPAPPRRTIDKSPAAIEKRLNSTREGREALARFDQSVEVA